MFEWLRSRNYPQASSLEMKWSFLTDEFKSNEYLKVYKYAQEEFVKELKELESTLEKFKEETNNLLSQLYKIEQGNFLMGII